MQDTLLNSNFPLTRSIHIDLGNQCNLSCPGCARTKSINDKSFIPSIMRLSDFKKIVNEDNKIKLIKFSGGHSDVIMTTFFFDILEYINSLSSRPNLFISTNGSGRPVSWWKELAELLNTGINKIQFAVDGLADTNHIYRIGSKWDTIISGIETLRPLVNSPSSMDWAYCVFEHNYHQVHQAYDLSKKLNIDQFILKIGDERTPNEMKLKSKDWKSVVSDLEEYRRCKQ